MNETDFIFPAIFNENAKEISEEEALSIAENFLTMDIDDEEVQRLIEDKIIERFPWMSGKTLEYSNLLVSVIITLHQLEKEGLVKQVENKWQSKNICVDGQNIV